MENGKKLEIAFYEPPMCCAGGLCGPSVDQDLLDLKETILKINEKFDGKVSIYRYLLNQNSFKFMENKEVFDDLRFHGISILPITTIDGKIVKSQEYPTFEELMGFIEK